MNIDLKNFSIKSKTLFLVDGIGALVTALSLFVINVFLNEYFGMPRSILIYLSAIAIAFCIYSLSCFVLVPQNSKMFLKIIGFANLFYCFLTTVFIFYYYHHLTILGITYFLVEIAVICALVLVELNIFRKLKD